MERYRIGLELLGQEAGRTLDLGCSMCELEWFIPTIGVDVNRIGLTEAKRERQGLELLLSRSETLPFKDGAFGAVILLETLEHVRDEIRTVQEIERVLKDQGLLVLSVPHARRLYEFLDLEYWLIPALTGRPEHRHYEQEWLHRFLEAHGFRVEGAFTRGMLRAAILRWFMFPLDVLDYLLFNKIRGPFGKAIRRLLNPGIDKEFSIETRGGGSLFIKARKTKSPRMSGHVPNRG